MSVFIDCDVLLDVALEREPFAASSSQVLDYMEQNPKSAAISWHSISNFYYIAVKFANSQQARDFIADLCDFLYVVPTGNPELVTALTLPMSDFEDAMQCAAALQFKADCIVTRNVDDYANAPISAITPAQFLERYL